MAEAGSVAERVKQQADIVRVVGEYVRLKKAGKDFSGLCPFHQEKTPSFTVSPIKQIFYCFGCGKGGDVYNFVMEMEKCEFPEAVKLVAEKCGISIPQPKERSPEGRKENQQRAVLVEMHREAQTFFVKQLEGTLEGKAARAYLEDRGLDKDAVARFGIGYAPSGGDVLLRHLKSKYNEKLLTESGLISRDQQGGKLFDRFRRRITFPIANESGKIVAFGCRVLGDDQPKYLNSPESPIYSKSNVLYHLDRAKEGIRRQDFVILVEGYMDAIAVARAGISNVVASCGTSLAEQQIKLLGRFTKRVIVNYDPDAYIREKGAEEYQNRLKEAPSFVDYLITRARQMDLSSGEAKTRAVNFLLPYVQKIPNRILRSEWATRIAQQLRLEEPVLRAALSKAAAERRSELKLQPELVAKSAKPVERRLIRMLAEAEGFRRELAERLQNARLYQGLETEKIFAALVVASLSRPPAGAAQPFHATEVAAVLDERDRRLLFE